MADDNEAIQHAEHDSRNGEEVHGRNRLSVIVQKGAPALGWFWVSSVPARIQREIVRSDTSKPSMRNSP